MGKIKPINGWTKAKIIEQIKDNMLDHKSVEDNECLYRASDGNKCAAGCFIPDALYDIDMEHKVIVDVLCSFTHLKKKMPLSLRNMKKLQDNHDFCGNDEDPRPKLINWIQENVEDR